MPAFAHAHTDDPLGLATEGDIVLVSKDEVLSQSPVDLMAETGLILTGASAVKLIEGIYTLTCVYEILTGPLAFDLNADIGTTYRISGCNVNCSSRTFPNVTVTAVRPAAGTLAAVLAAAKKHTVSITGGFGMVNLWGATCASSISSTMSITSRMAMAIAPTSGAIVTAGLAVFGWTKNCSIEGYVLPVLAAGSYETGGHGTGAPRTSRDGFEVYSKSWRMDMAFA